MTTSRPNKRGAGKGGFAVLLRAGRVWPALPDRERKQRQHPTAQPRKATTARALTDEGQLHRSSPEFCDFCVGQRLEPVPPSL